MECSVYIGNEAIHAVMGRAGRKGVQIERVCSEPLAPGAVIGGVFIDEAAVKAALCSLWGCSHLPQRGVRLVVGGRSVFLKRSVVPTLSRGKLQRVLVDEFPEVEDPAELLYDYAVLTPRLPEGGGAVLCTAAPRAFIQSYRQLFASAGIGLRSAELNIGGLIKVARLSAALQRESCVVVVLDDLGVDLTLLAAGDYRFCNRSRLLEGRGTLQSAAEIGRLLSSMVQFNASEKGEPVKHVYLAGLKEGEEGLCAALGESLGIAADPFPDCPEIAALPRRRGCQFTLAEHLYAVGGLIRTGGIWG